MFSEKKIRKSYSLPLFSLTSNTTNISKKKKDIKNYLLIFYFQNLVKSKINSTEPNMIMLFADVSCYFREGSIVSKGCCLFCSCSIGRKKKKTLLSLTRLIIHSRPLETFFALGLSSTH